MSVNRAQGEEVARDRTEHALLPRDAATTAGNRLARMENDMVKRLMWSGLLTGVGALASIVSARVAATVWRRLFDEEPPE